MIVDGKDISTLNVQSYRKAVALVQQEPTLYAGSIRFNIALGAFIPPEQVTQEQVEAAAKQANIHDFVMGLPDAYDTEVGGKGASLSGGQKRESRVIAALHAQRSQSPREASSPVRAPSAPRIQLVCHCLCSRS